MRIKWRFSAALFLAPLLALAQGGTGTIHGTIYGPEGERVSYLWIRANDADSHEAARNESTSVGEYSISILQSGTYTLEINTPCCAYRNYESESIHLAEGESLEFDVWLEEGDSFNTVGDDPGVIAAAIRSEAVIPDEPPPRMASGKPDFSGVWLIGADPFPEEIKAQPWAEEVFQERIATSVKDHPHTRCLPGDPPITGGAAPFIAKFVQKDDLIIVLMEDYPGFRQIFLDGRPHPEFPNPSWMGHSVGHWEGDMLVVDTVGFNDRGWMSVYPRSEDLHIVERYTRNEYGVMSLEMTVEDANVFEASWDSQLPLHLAPHIELIEYVCENNKWGAPGN